MFDLGNQTVNGKIVVDKDRMECRFENHFVTSRSLPRGSDLKMITSLCEHSILSGFKFCNALSQLLMTS